MADRPSSCIWQNPVDTPEPDERPMPHLSRHLIARTTIVLLATLLSACGDNGDSAKPAEPATASWNEFNWDETNWE